MTSFLRWLEMVSLFVALLGLGTVMVMSYHKENSIDTDILLAILFCLLSGRFGTLAWRIERGGES